MPRLLFEKTGNAVWISHLDLMRVFQRAFKRANLPLTHTHGFNPRPSVSIALPLSVGVESKCELLDFDLDGCEISCEEVKERLNSALITGVKVLDVYSDGRKIRELSLLQCRIAMEYAEKIPEDAAERISALFAQSEVVVPKKTKSGIQDQNIVTMIRKINIQTTGERELTINALICCQNPTLNPAQIPLAVERYLPELKPVSSVCSRIEVYDLNEKIFR
jgi:radical SAM-linked protein